MDSRAYELMAALEAEHWWYRGRRAVLRRLLSRIELQPGARLLEVGAGTGGNLALLHERGHAFGVEPSDLGRELGARAWGGRVARATAEALPFCDHRFDLVAALDVLEHLLDDLQALDEMRRVLRPGGWLVLHVPAYTALWGHEDVISRHLRRYRAAQIRRLLAAAGFTIEQIGYTTTLLLPLVAAVKIGKRMLLGAERPVSDVERLPWRPVNEALAAIQEIEAEVAASSELPFGASILALARRAG